MKQIDYSVPDKEKDVKAQFNIGEYVEGDCLYHKKGKITKIEMSTGERKGLLYWITNNRGIDDCFFYNFIKPWYDGMIADIIGKDVDYVPERTIKFRLGGTDYTITALRFSSVTDWCYAKVDKKEGTTLIDNEGNRGIGFYALRQSQKRKIFNEVFWGEYGKPYDRNGKVIQRGDKVLWIDPETGRKTKYEVWDYPTKDMVKLTCKYGECEALPHECIVLK